MADNIVGIVEALCDLSVHEGLRVAIKESAKGASIVGGCSLIGALVGGPIGLAAGAAVGTAVGVASMSKYKPVVQVIMEDMTPEQREQLANAFIQAFRNIGANDVMLILSVVMNDESVKALALDVLKAFLSQEGYAIA